MFARANAATLTLLAILQLSVLAHPQVTPASPQRDAAAVAQVQVALQAMGGTDAIGAVQDCVATGSTSPAPGSPQPAGTFQWKHAGGQFRYESTGTSQRTALVSGHGKPAAIDGSNVRPLNGHMARANVAPHLPAVILLRSVNNPRIAIASAGTATIAGRPAIRVKLWDDSSPGLRVITAQVWYFDTATGIPLRLDYKLPNNNNGLETTDSAIEFSDFRHVSGVIVPFQITTYVDAQPFSTIKLDVVTFNSGIPPDQFDAPAGGTQ